MLNRHPDLSSDDEEYLAHTLLIPQQWVHESKAAKLASEGDAYGEYHELIRAGAYHRAHRVLIDKLAPEAVIRKDVGLLRRLCGLLDEKHPDGWEYGGKVCCKPYE